MRLIVAATNKTRKFSYIAFRFLIPLDAKYICPVMLVQLRCEISPPARLSPATIKSQYHYSNTVPLAWPG